MDLEEGRLRKQTGTFNLGTCDFSYKLSRVGATGLGTSTDLTKCLSARQGHTQSEALHKKRQGWK